jgi:hypothetical protein
MTRLAPVLLALLAFALASCGGGDDDGSPSEADFAERAEEICRETKDVLEGVAPEDADSAEDLADAVDQVIEESETAVDELAELERPEGRAGERAQAFVQATRDEIQGEAVPALEDLKAALQDGDQQAAQDAARALQQIDSSATNQAAREVGAKDCGEG